MRKLCWKTLLMLCIMVGDPFPIYQRAFASDLFSSTPKIINYNTFPFVVKDGWLCIPNEDNVLTVEVTAMNTKEILFYLTPTGTATANLSVLIGRSNGKNGLFTIKHKFLNDESILHHFSVVAISQTGHKTTDTLFNIVRCD